MRPPSYYASIVKSNNSSTGHSYSSQDYDTTTTTTTPRTSSQQLRSSLSSPSSSSYVSRSHLPFVAQSTLVAHCFTGVGSSTRPYGSTNSSSPSSSYRGANHTSPYISSSSSSLGSSSSSSYTNSVSSLSSRQPSTKRAYSSSNYSTSTVSSSALLRPSYHHIGQPSSLSSSSSLRATSSATSRYRPTPSTSSYYKPIRLRERPLLTQISRQIGSPTPPPPPPSSRQQRLETANDDRLKTIHSKANESETSENSEVTNRTDVREAGPDVSEQVGVTVEPPDDWSSDIGRNISRNKYLIKFREIDKHQTGGRASIVDVEATIELPKESDDINLGTSEIVTNNCEQSKLLEPEDNRAAEVVGSNLEKGRDTRETQHEMRLTVSGEDCLDVNKTTPVKREKKNVKLRLRKVGGKVAAAKPNDAEATTTIIDKRPIKDEQTITKNDPIRVDEPPPPAAPDKKLAKVKRVIRAKEDKDDDQGIEKAKIATTVEKTIIEIKQNKTSDTTTTAKIRPKKRTKKGGAEDEDLSATRVEVEDRLDKVGPVSKPGALGTILDGTPSASQRQPLAPLQTTKQPNSRRQSQSDQFNSQTPASPKKTSGRIRFREYNIDDFNFLTVLGHGGWGFVILAELKEHDACFAVKCIKKITIVEDDDYDSIMIERKVLALGNIHPFICKLFCTFETDGYLFFVMEYCAGGDLMFHVQHEGKFTESRCRFYAAEIICAIRFLHNRHIIYRDLKLDNILLDERGHIRLVDFGMCQCRTYREEMLPSNFCGTPEYISPEIIKGVPYNHSVDWWSFGVLLYEMAVGKMPFRGNDENELLWNVCYEQIHYPMFLSKELTSLLKLLLEREPNMRMGMATCKAGDIYDQPYFRGVDWKAVEEMRVEPPFVPEVRSKRDVSNFDSDFTESTCELSPVDESTLAKIDQKQFQQFPYTNPDIFIFDTNQSA